MIKKRLVPCCYFRHSSNKHSFFYFVVSKTKCLQKVQMDFHLAEFLMVEIAVVQILETPSIIASLQKVLYQCLSYICLLFLVQSAHTTNHNTMLAILLAMLVIQNLPMSFPFCRFYLIAGGVPLIICGITAAVNINNYGDNIP